MMNWFKNCKSIEEAKELYKKLCRQYHPDMNDTDTTATMQQINEQFTRAFETLKNKHRAETQQDNTAEQNTETAETATEFMQIINSLIHCEGLIIDLVGRWIWLTGNTYEHKDIIKSLGFRFASKKKAWYWHKLEDSCKSRKNLTLDEIKSKYGTQNFATISTPRITATA